jgi:hypothetical protein
VRGDAFEYDVRLLQQAGYLGRGNRFWTTQDFADAKSVHDRIESKLKQLRLYDPGLKYAYETLQSED